MAQGQAARSPPREPKSRVLRFAQNFSFGKASPFLNRSLRDRFSAKSLTLVCDVGSRCGDSRSVPQGQASRSKAKPGLTLPKGPSPVNVPETPSLHRFDTYRVALEFRRHVMRWLPLRRTELSDQLDRASISIVLNIAEAMCSQCLLKNNLFRTTAAGWWKLLRELGFGGHFGVRG